LPGVDPAVVGARMRHERRARHRTLGDIAAATGSSPSHLSQIERGRRAPSLRLLSAVAAVLSVPVSDLLRPEPPSRRSALELAIERAQDGPLLDGLGLPPLRPGPRVPTDVLEHVAGLYGELRRRSERSVATPEEARAANRELRASMRASENYSAAIEAAAAGVLDAVGYGGTSALSQRVLLDIAAHCGFTLRYLRDLPRSVRSIADLRHRRLYLAEGEWTGGHDTRSVLLQALGQFVLHHGPPVDFGDYLRHRIEANYFAAAVLIPERAAVPLLQQAKADQELAVEDLRDLFSVSYEMAAHRFTNLATRHLNLRVHFVRTDADGRIYKAYENDGVTFPADVDGAIEGQRICRHSAARQVFRAAADSHDQYTDTPTGTYWCSSRVVGAEDERFAVTVGARYEDSRWFRGRDTGARAASTCPDVGCCLRPPRRLAARWDSGAWPAARAQSHVLAAIPPGAFPGVDLTEVYEFLDRHADEE